MKNILTILLATIAAVTITGTVHAADLNLQANPTVQTGQVISVRIVLNTQGENINAVSTDIAFPEDVFEAVQINTGASSFNLFAEKEIRSGLIKLSAGQPSPGLSGVHEVATLNFRALKEGQGTFSFTQNAATINNEANEDTLASSPSITVQVLNPEPVEQEPAQETQPEATVEQEAPAQEDVVEEAPVEEEQDPTTKDLLILSDTEFKTLSFEQESVRAAVLLATAQEISISAENQDTQIHILNKTELKTIQKDGSISQITLLSEDNEPVQIYVRAQNALLDLALSQDAFFPKQEAAIEEEESSSEPGFFAENLFFILVLLTLPVAAIILYVIWYLARKRAAQNEAQQVSSQPDTAQLAKELLPSQEPQQPESQSPQTPQDNTQNQNPQI